MASAPNTERYILAAATTPEIGVGAESYLEMLKCATGIEIAAVPCRTKKKAICTMLKFSYDVLASRSCCFTFGDLYNWGSQNLFIILDPMLVKSWSVTAEETELRVAEAYSCDSFERRARWPLQGGVGIFRWWQRWIME